MLEISKSTNNIGSTFSSANANIYNQFKKNQDGEVFERVVFDLMLNKYSDDADLSDYILSLPNDKQRMALLSLIDGDSALWSKMNSYINECSDKFEHIKDVIKIMAKFVKDGEVERKKFGEVMTPISLVREMLNTLPKEVWSNPDLKWLDPCNGAGTFPYVVIYMLMNGLSEWEPDTEKRYKHIVENMIYTCELQSRNVFLWLCGVDPKNEYTTNSYWGSFLDTEFDFHMKNVWDVKKFDIIIGNPPYQKSLHIDFLNKSGEISNKILFIHPSPWFFRRESFAKNKLNRIESIKLLNGNFYFKNAEFGAPLSVTYIVENLTENIKIIYDTSENVYNIDSKSIPNGFWEPNESIIKIVNKFKKISSERNLSNILSKSKGEYFISAPRICGHAVYRNDKNKFVTNDYYTLFYKNSNLSDDKTSNKVFVVNNENEKKRLVFYMKTKICRFGLYINKLSQDSHIVKYLHNIPIPPLDKDYTESEICEIFDISNEEYKIIDSLINNYYI